MADLLTTRQVTDLLKIDRTTIYRMVDSGQMPAIRVGKQWRFARADIERFLAAPTTVEPVQSAGSAKPKAESEPIAATQSVPANLEQPLGELLPLTVVQMMQDTIADALGVTVVTTDMAGTPITEVSNACGLYNMMLNDDESVQHCIQEWQRIAGLVTLEPKFMSNMVGLLCARGLIRAGNQLKGMVFFGGIAPEQWPPGQERVLEIAEQYHLPPTALMDHIDEVYRLDRRQRNDVLSFVQRTADIFSTLLEERGK